MPPNITTLGFDADDTLWHDAHDFRLTEDRFVSLLTDYTDRLPLEEHLLAAQRRNGLHYGHGVRGFTLSMIETAIEVTSGKVPADVIAEILEAGRDMLSRPVAPLPHVEETLKTLRGAYRLVLITEGDLFDQQRKVTASGLDAWFDAVEIVAEKSVPTYRTLFSRHGSGPAEAMMIGNSLKSDILPALEAGAFGAHVPYHATWTRDEAAEPQGADRFHRIDHIGKVPQLLARLG
ncbi:HAD family hydrolase [Labrenzia sp. 011]|uniref:HAD family hydrolase n=1 Tax=Labrenzia sp. 011 TaxID=2171494 RepID=UPI000D51579F|nr:HAD family hydrolase [Labrenzia sp. 011]PVB63404.1 HAD family hydrolase [Labrenzia sp. 011]